MITNRFEQFEMDESMALARGKDGLSLLIIRGLGRSALLCDSDAYLPSLKRKIRNQHIADFIALAICVAALLFFRVPSWGALPLLLVFDSLIPLTYRFSPLLPRELLCELTPKERCALLRTLPLQKRRQGLVNLVILILVTNLILFIFNIPQLLQPMNMFFLLLMSTFPIRTGGNLKVFLSDK